MVKLATRECFGTSVTKFDVFATKFDSIKDGKFGTLSKKLNANISYHLQASVLMKLPLEPK